MNSLFFYSIQFQRLDWCDPQTKGKLQQVSSSNDLTERYAAPEPDGWRIDDGNCAVTRPASVRDFGDAPVLHSLDPQAPGVHQNTMLIYKIFRDPEWTAFQDAGETLGAPIDLSDGFIHFSNAQQAGETAAKHFAGVTGLWLVAFDADNMGEALKWEPSRNDALFPHLYRALRLDEVVWSKPLPLVNGAHQFPPEMV